MTLTKRVSKYAAIFWGCLLALVFTLRAANLPVAGIRPEGLMLTLMMTLPFTLAATALVIGATWTWERRRR